MSTSILMGDPAHFRILGGSNPHTRNLFGFRKKVDHDLAYLQWHNLARTLQDLGVDVYVIPPQKTAPGLVYPANAGFISTGGTFVLSNLIESRKSEEPFYKKFIQSLGFETATVSKRFEGEADLFPFQDKMIFTFGKLIKQHFSLRLGFPPWKRKYGFRSDQTMLPELQDWIRKCQFLTLELINEYFYHGDTALCSFGPGRELLLVYYGAFNAISRKILMDNYYSSIIPLSEKDARIYAANSYYVEVNEKYYLIMPDGVSQQLIQQIEVCGVKVICVDVSEFLKKGGGSVKCMIGTLGTLPESTDENILKFRKEHLYNPYCQS